LFAHKYNIVYIQSNATLNRRKEYNISLGGSTRWAIAHGHGPPNIIESLQNKSYTLPIGQVVITPNTKETLNSLKQSISFAPVSPKPRITAICNWLMNTIKLTVFMSVAHTSTKFNDLFKSEGRLIHYQSIVYGIKELVMDSTPFKLAYC
jgi:hypothetical protein